VAELLANLGRPDPIKGQSSHDREGVFEAGTLSEGILKEKMKGGRAAKKGNRGLRGSAEFVAWGSGGGAPIQMSRGKKGK